MSTSPDTGARADDRIVKLLSRWLARHIGDDEARREIEAIGMHELAPGQAEGSRSSSKRSRSRPTAALSSGSPARRSKRSRSASSLHVVFTGIVRERGRVAAVEGGEDGVRLRVEAPVTASGVSLGDSVAVNGCCLTAVEVADGCISFDAVPETLRRTSLGRLEPGTAVNLEPAVRAGEPLGGHYVQGHVDGVGRVRFAEPEGEGSRVWIEAPPEVLRYCVEKGSVAVEGVSLTVAELAQDAFAVALVLHTLVETTLGGLEPGREVNLEADVLAKYVEKLLTRDVED